MKHAKTPIQSEVSVAIHALNVCNIAVSLYSRFLQDNVKRRAGDAGQLHRKRLPANGALA